MLIPKLLNKIFGNNIFLSIIETLQLKKMLFFSKLLFFQSIFSGFIFFQFEKNEPVSNLSSYHGYLVIPITNYKFPNY